MVPVSTTFAFRYSIKNITNSNLTAVVALANNSSKSFNVDVQDIKSIDPGDICMHSITVIAKDGEFQGQHFTFGLGHDTCNSIDLVARKTQGLLQLTTEIST